MYVNLSLFEGDAAGVTALLVRVFLVSRSQVAEMVPNDVSENILKETRANLEAYLKGVKMDDLKRSPETRAALFGAMDSMRSVLATAACRACGVRLACRAVLLDETALFAPLLAFTV